jgi:hypothetical protein
MRSAPILAALDEGRDELAQVLGLLRAAGATKAEELPLGEGDRRLLGLHVAITGREAELTVACGGCGAVNAASLGPAAVPRPGPRLRPLGGGGGLREPTYADLLELPAEREAAAAELLRRCVVGAPRRAPTEDDLQHVDDSLAGPLLLECVACGAPVEAAVDVQRLVLELLQRHAVEVDAEVHLLASGYHWDLASIEGLPDARRRRLARLVAEAP